MLINHIAIFKLGVILLLYKIYLTWISESSARSFFDFGPGTGVSTDGAVYSPGHKEDAILTITIIILIWVKYNNIIIY